MNEHASAAGEQRPEAGGAIGPCSLEGRVWNVEVGNWPMMPFHMPSTGFLAQARDVERLELPRLHQGDHRRRIPGSYAVEIDGQIPPMRAGEGVELLFAWRKGNADQAATVAHMQLGRSGLSGEVRIGRRIAAPVAAGIDSNAVRRDEPVGVMLDCPTNGSPGPRHRPSHRHRRRCYGRG
jgi:hypothetical protein